MPSSDTISAWYTFTADTIADDREVNSNFDVFRGHLIPVDPTAGTANNGNYDLGSTTYKWRNIYADSLVLQTATGASPSWFTYTVTSSDFSGATTTNQSTLFTNPTSGVIHAVALKKLTQFQGGSITDYKISVGISGNSDKYALATTVFTSTIFTIFNSLDGESDQTTSSIIAEAVATGSNLDSATAGQLEISILRSKLP